MQDTCAEPPGLQILYITRYLMLEEFRLSRFAVNSKFIATTKFWDSMPISHVMPCPVCSLGKAHHFAALRITPWTQIIFFKLKQHSRLLRFLRLKLITICSQVEYHQRLAYDDGRSPPYEPDRPSLSCSVVSTDTFVRYTSGK